MSHTSRDQLQPPSVDPTRVQYMGLPPREACTTTPDRSTATRRDRIVFPPVDEVPDKAPLRHVANGALLKLQDGSLHYLRATGIPWTTERLDAVELAFAQVQHEVQSREELTRQLEWHLSMSRLTLLTPVLDRVDPSLWDTRRTAVAIVSRMLCLGHVDPDPCSAGERVRAIEARFRQKLEIALAEFNAGLDAEALSLAAQDGTLDVGVYNYLVREPHRKWRMQFARAFPILVRAAASGTRGSIGEHVRAVVDTGTSLPKYLAARWAVSPGALRAMSRHSVSHIGLRWRDEPHTLARILDALRPEDRPGRDPESWARLARAVAMAEEFFHRPVTSTPLTLGWLRQAARNGFARIDDDRPGRGMTPGVVPLVDELRRALVRLLATSEPGRADAGFDLLTAVTGVVDRHLAALPLGQLANMASAFAREYASRRATLEGEMQSADGRVFWPLLPHDFLPSSGHRRVTCVVSDDDVRREGTRQDLCIMDGAALACILRSLATGQTYLLSIRDPNSGAPHSTAEVRRVLAASGRVTGLAVCQHKAKGNARPHTECVAALREALEWAASREVQAHLELGRREAWKRRKVDPDTEARVDIAVLPTAIQIALGRALYASVVRAVEDCC